MGKKNWLFIGEPRAGERSAIFFTLIEACRHRSIDPQTYLHKVLTRLPTLNYRQIKEVTPEAWASTNSTSAQRKARVALKVIRQRFLYGRFRVVYNTGENR